MHDANQQEIKTYKKPMLQEKIKVKGRIKLSVNKKKMKRTR